MSPKGWFWIDYEFGPVIVSTLFDSEEAAHAWHKETGKGTTLCETIWG